MSDIHSVSAPSPVRVDQPAALAGRIQSIDVLRGIAVFGILLENIIYFLGPRVQWDLQAPLWPAAVDQTVVFLLRWLEEGKMYALYSLLFGLGLTMQYDRSRSQGGFGGLGVRRMFVLLGFGLVHGLLIWWGDILTAYALLGFLLLPFLRCGDRTVLRWAFGTWLVPAALILLLGLALRAAPPDTMPDPVAEAVSREAKALEEVKSAERAYRHGTWAEIAAYRAYDFGQSLISKAGGAFTIFMMFLFGVWAARQRIAERDARTDPLLRRLLAWGLPVGLAMHAFYAYNTCQTTPQPLSTEILTKIIWALLGLPLLTFGYIALVLRVAQHPTLSRWLAPLRAVGEMSLTNYLTHSIIGTLLAYRIGLGLYGQISPAMCMPIAVAIFAVQIPLSNWWLRQFRFGPAEWLWRSATYLRMQPMRR